MSGHDLAKRFACALAIGLAIRLVAYLIERRERARRRKERAAKLREIQRGEL